MGRVEEIEAAIEGLPPEDQDRWDIQMDSDSSAGKLDFLFDEAESDRLTGS